MLDAEWSVDEVAEVALVEVSVHNPTAVDRRVRVENELDGPTLPPRTEGVPEAGWDADGYAGVVPAGDRLRLGFASPAPAAEPPVAVEDAGRVDGDASADGPDAAAALRMLGDGSPPADALPAAEPVDGAPTGSIDGTNASEPVARDGPTAAATDADVSASVGPAGGESATGPTTADVDPAPGATGPTSATGDPGAGAVEGEASAGDGSESAAASVEGADGADAAASDGATGPDAPDPAAGHGPTTAATAAGGEVPRPVGDWLAEVEGRIEHAERLTDASVVEAAAVLDERGGLAAVESLPERLTADEAALRALSERATALADRAATTDVPLAALRRLS